MMLKRKTGLNGKTKRGAPRKSTSGIGKKTAYVIHRRPSIVPMMQASNDICKSCKETLILTVEDFERVSLECIHTRVRKVSRI